MLRQLLCLGWWWCLSRGIWGIDEEVMTTCKRADLSAFVLWSWDAEGWWWAGGGNSFMVSLIKENSV